MVGPKLPGVEYSHSYGPVPQKAPPQGEMVGPVYQGVEQANQVISLKKRIESPTTRLALN